MMRSLRQVAALATAFAVGCSGLLGLSDYPPGGTGPTESDAGIEISDAAGDRADASGPRLISCKPDGLMGVPQRVGGLHEEGSTERSIVLTRDELTAYFSRATLDADGGLLSDFRLFTASRASRDRSFDPPTSVPFTTPAIATQPRLFDLYPSLLAGDDLLYLVRIRDVAEELYVVDRRKPFPPALTDVNRVIVGNQKRVPGQFWMLLAEDRSDPSEVFFSQPLDEAGSEGVLVRAVRSSATEIGAWTPLEGVHAASRVDYRPVVRNAGSHVYFASNRSDTDAGGNGYDVFVAIREDGGYDIRAVAGLRTPGVGDLLDWVSEDECRIYFTRRENGLYGLFLVEREER